MTEPTPLSQFPSRKARNAPPLASVPAPLLSAPGEEEPEAPAPELAGAEAQWETWASMLTRRPSDETLRVIGAELESAMATYDTMARAAIAVAHRTRDVSITAEHALAKGATLGGNAIVRERFVGYYRAYRLFDLCSYAHAARIAAACLNTWPYDPFLMMVQACADLAGGIESASRQVERLTTIGQVPEEIGLMACKAYWSAVPTHEHASALLTLCHQLRTELAPGEPEPYSAVAQAHPDAAPAPLGGHHRSLTDALLGLYEAYGLRVQGSLDEALGAINDAFSLLGELSQRILAPGAKAEVTALYGSLARERDCIRQAQWLSEHYQREAPVLLGLQVEPAAPVEVLGSTRYEPELGRAEFVPEVLEAKTLLAFTPAPTSPAPARPDRRVVASEWAGERGLTLGLLVGIFLGLLPLLVATVQNHVVKQGPTLIHLVAGLLIGIGGWQLTRWRHKARVFAEVGPPLGVVLVGVGTVVLVRGQQAWQGVEAITELALVLGLMLLVQFFGPSPEVEAETHEPMPTHRVNGFTYPGLPAEPGLPGAEASPPTEA